MPAAGVQQDRGAFDVDVAVMYRLLNGRPDAGTRCEMDDDADRRRREDLVDQCVIPDVSFDQHETGTSGEVFEVPALDLRQVKIVEIVEDNDLPPLSEERFNQVGADEPRPASDQDVRHRSSSHSARDDLPGQSRRNREILRARRGAAQVRLTLLLRAGAAVPPRWEAGESAGGRRRAPRSRRVERMIARRAIAS